MRSLGEGPALARCSPSTRPALARHLPEADSRLSSVCSYLALKSDRKAEGGVESVGQPRGDARKRLFVGEGKVMGQTNTADGREKEVAPWPPE